MNSIQAALMQKIGDIRYGLLRFRENNEQYTLQVKVAGDDESPRLKCVITGLHPGRKMLYKHVNLLQKNKDEYLYIAGKVTEEKQTSKAVLSIEIKKACLFVRRSNGSASWLQQKQVFESEEKNADLVEA